jgi:hypothetical protein
VVVSFLAGREDQAAPQAAFHRAELEDRAAPEGVSLASEDREEEYLAI